MLSFGLMLAWGLVAALRFVARVGELVIRLRGQAEVERARQFALAGMLLAMPPHCLVVQQHPDGTTCLLARGIAVPSQANATTPG